MALDNQFAQACGYLIPIPDGQQFSTFHETAHLLFMTDWQLFIQLCSDVNKRELRHLPLHRQCEPDLNWRGENLLMLPESSCQSRHPSETIRATLLACEQPILLFLYLPPRTKKRQNKSCNMTMKRSIPSGVTVEATSLSYMNKGQPQSPT